MNRTARVLAALAFVGCILAANYVTARYGFVPVGFGLMATAGTYFAGLALLARDVVQDTAGRLAVVGLIVVGAALSWWLSTPALAVASGVAFLVSELADMAIYTPLRRKTWAGAVVVSNTVGALVDSLIFLTLAGFPVWLALPGQMVAKVGITLATVALVLVVRSIARPQTA